MGKIDFVEKSILNMGRHPILVLEDSAGQLISKQAMGEIGGRDFLIECYFKVNAYHHGDLFSTNKIYQ